MSEAGYIGYHAARLGRFIYGVAAGPGWGTRAALAITVVVCLSLAGSLHYAISESGSVGELRSDLAEMKAYWAARMDERLKELAENPLDCGRRLIPYPGWACR